MSALTPTPLPKPRADEVTQPNLTPGMAVDDARRGLARSPAQWEAEALALVEEADARSGPAAGALRYAAARLFEEGVGDVAAAMDHLRLALDESAEPTFWPVLRALRLHAIEAGSYWTAIDLLEVEQKGATEAGGRVDLVVEKAYLLEHRLEAPAPARALLEEALAQQPGHAAALLALEESALGGVGRGDAADAALLQSVLERRLAAARSGGARGRLLCRLALIAEADPARATEALGFWLRALDEEAGLGAAALARAGARRVAAALGKFADLARVAALEAEAAIGT